MPEEIRGARPEGHSVASAAAVIEGLFSDTEDNGTSETPEDSVETSPEVTDNESEVEVTDDETPSTDDNESDEQADATDDEPVQPRKLKVKQGDQEEEVTEEELVKGYLRQKDYTQKTQKLAEERNKFTPEAEGVRRERAEIANRLTDLRKALESYTAQEPDWAQLQQDMEPAEFAATWARWDQHTKRVDAVKAQEREAHEKVARDNAQAFAKHLEGEQAKLVEAIPAWKNDAVAKKEKAELVNYATDVVGFSQEDLASVTDHRVLLLLRNAFLHHKAQQARPKADAKIDKVKVAAPGTPSKTPSKQVTEETRRKQRLAKTGSLRDAASVFESMLD